MLLNLLSNAVKFTERGEVVVTVGGAPMPARRGGRPLGDSASTSATPASASRPTRWAGCSSPSARSTPRSRGAMAGPASALRSAAGWPSSWTAPWPPRAGRAGEGSVFRLAVRMAAAAPMQSPQSGRCASTPTSRAGRVLVVDDNATNRRILVAQTARWGMVPRETGSPREALDWLRAGERFDIALFDLLMPELDGLELAERSPALAADDGARRCRSSSSRRSGIREREGAASRRGSRSRSSRRRCTTRSRRSCSAAAARPARHRGRTATDARLGERHPLRILLAEDNPVNQKLALRLLAQLSYEAEVAADGLEAIAALERDTSTWC